MTSSHSITLAEKAVLQALAYFDVFDYPLTKEEVFHFCRHQQINLKETEAFLKSLVNQGLVCQYGQFFQTKKDENWQKERLLNNERAARFLPMARKMAAFIQAFPFVRAVFVSGSLSKQCMRTDSDIDFFIVTAPQRLWLARGLLILFKKIFLFNSHKYFCVNYFIDTEHLEIEEKNLFTATEIITLMPMCGKELYMQFQKANHWAWQIFPNAALRDTRQMPACRSGWTKRSLEYLLSGNLGAWLDRTFMRTMLAFWKRKFKHFDANTFDTALKSTPHVSKHHPLHFQEKVLKAYRSRIKALGIEDMD
jgi:hypothetical protein